VSFSITSNNPDIRFVAQFGAGPAVITDGYGGWEVKARPKEIGITEWVGRNPMAIEIPFMVDHFRDEENGGIKTEAMVRNLERLCGIGTHDHPPICTVDGGGAIPHDATTAPSSHHRWVVENVSWDRDLEVRSASSARRLRCGGTLTIRQYLEANALDRLAIKKKNKKKSKKGRKSGKSRTHTVRSGETLSSISNRYYGTPSKWAKIGDANNIRDPNNIRVGQVLHIP
jgi:LysM repeat protein